MNYLIHIIGWNTWLRLLRWTIWFTLLGWSTWFRLLRWTIWFTLLGWSTWFRLLRWTTWFRLLRWTTWLDYWDELLLDELLDLDYLNTWI